MAHSLDQVGVFGATVEDAKLLINAIKSFDPMDMTSIQTADISSDATS